MFNTFCLYHVVVMLCNLLEAFLSQKSLHVLSSVLVRRLVCAVSHQMCFPVSDRYGPILEKNARITRLLTGADFNQIKAHLG
jgi:hypothetical protein